MSDDRHCVYPGARAPTSPDTTFLPPVVCALAEMHYYVTKRYRMRIDFSVDPATSASSSTTYALEFEILRNLGPGPMLEPILFLTGVFDWDGTIDITSPDDVFNSINLGGAFYLFQDGWVIPTDPGGPPVGSVMPSYRFNFTGVYDDGSEGTFYATTDPPASIEPPLPGTAQVVTSVVTILPPGGVGDPIITACHFIDTEGGGVSPYFFGGQAPAITLTPLEAYEWRRSDDTEPMWDAATFALLGDPYSTAL